MIPSLLEEALACRSSVCNSLKFWQVCLLHNLCVRSSHIVLMEFLPLHLSPAETTLHPVDDESGNISLTFQRTFCLAGQCHCNLPCQSQICQTSLPEHPPLGPPPATIYPRPISHKAPSRD